MTITDPTAIDLEVLAQKHATSGLTQSETDELFAVVELLRGRVAWLEVECALRKSQQGKHLVEEIQLRKRIETAEAINRDMRKALETLDTTIVNALDGHRSGVLTSVTGASQVYADEVLQESEAALKPVDKQN